jgi:hypothetical protein
VATDLATLSLARADLPRFEGVTLQEQLLAGRDAALAALSWYVPVLIYDPDAAAATLRQISAWAERNASEIGAVLSDPSAVALPEHLQLTLGSDRAQQFLIAIFTVAAEGLGPWASGMVTREVATGKRIGENWARADAEARLQVFGGIVKMNADGHLALFFTPPVGGVSGFGIPPLLVWAVVVAVVGLAGVVTCYLFAAKRVELNNRLMRDLCAEAQAKGDAETVRQCVGAAEGLQKGTPFAFLEGFEGLLQKVGTAVIAGVLVYVLARWMLPAVVRAASAPRTALRRRPAYAEAEWEEGD